MEFHEIYSIGVLQRILREGSRTVVQFVRLRVAQSEKQERESGI